MAGLAASAGVVRYSGGGLVTCASRAMVKNDTLTLLVCLTLFSLGLAAPESCPSASDRSCCWRGCAEAAAIGSVPHCCELSETPAAPESFAGRAAKVPFSPTPWAAFASVRFDSARLKRAVAPRARAAPARPLYTLDCTLLL